MFYKVIKDCKRIASGNRPAETFVIPAGIREILFNPVEQCLRDAIRFESQGAWRPVIIGKAFAIIVIKIPLTANRFAIRFHQDTGCASQLPIEILHTEFLAVFSKFRKYRKWGKETIIVANIKDDTELVRPCFDFRAYPPFAGLCNDYLFYRMIFQCQFQGIAKAIGRLVLIIEITNRETLFT